MTTLAYPQVNNPQIEKSGENIILTWNDNANPDASYKVYAADSADPLSWGEAVATIAAQAANSYSFAATGVDSKYFKINTLIPNYGDGEYQGANSGAASDEQGWNFPDGFTATYDTAVEYDNSVVLGYQKVSLEGDGTGYTFISSMFDGGYASIDGFGNDLNFQNIETISEWDETTQGWLTDTWADGSFDDGSGFNVSYNAYNAYYLKANADRDVYIMGTVPASPVYNLITTSTTDLNFIVIPLDCEITTAAALGADMGTDNTVMISTWDAANQSWQSCVYISSFDAWVGSFNITPGMPIVVGAEQNFTWPSQ